MRISKDQFHQLFGFTIEDYDGIISQGLKGGVGMPRSWGCGLYIRPKDEELNHFVAKLHSNHIDSEGYIGQIYYKEEGVNIYKTRVANMDLNLQLGEIEITRLQLARLTFKNNRKKDIEGRLLSMIRDHKAVYYHYAVRIEATRTGFKFTGENVGATSSRLYDKEGNEFPIFKCAMMYGSGRYRPDLFTDTFHSIKRLDEVDILLDRPKSVSTYVKDQT